MWPFKCHEAKINIGERMSDMILLSDKRLSKQIQETDEKLFRILDVLKSRIDEVEIKLKELETK